MKTGTFRLAFLIAAFIFGGVFSQAAYAQPSCQTSDYQRESFMGMPISSGFGMRNRPTAGASTFHRAIDLAVSGPVNSRHGGVVSVGPGGTGLGNHVFVTSGNLQVLYAHAGRLDVQAGQVISPGQRLGNWTGCTGTCAGDHIHLEYRVQGDDGVSYRVDPHMIQSMIDSGALDPNDPNFAEQAIALTEASCSVDRSSLEAGAGAGGHYNEVDEMCDPNIRSQIVNQSQAVLAFRQEAMQQIIVPPPAPSMIANTPCHSKELQRATDIFSNMPQQFMGGMGGAMGGLGNAMGGPASSIMNQFFEAGVTSMNEAAGSLPGMLNFQQLASDALGGLLSSLGVSGGFSNELCGMMVDMVVNFLQCQFPLELPDFPSLDLGFPSLNDLLPQGCAGDAARKLIYEGAANMPNLSQTPALGNRSLFAVGQ